MAKILTANEHELTRIDLSRQSEATADHPIRVHSRLFAVSLILFGRFAALCTFARGRSFHHGGWTQPPYKRDTKDQKRETRNEKRLYLSQIMQIGLTGASGFIGREIIRQARNQQDVVVGFSRSPARAIPGSPQVRAFGPEMDLNGLDAVIHLAGEPIIGLWTPAKQRRILESRVQGTRWLVDSATRAKQPPSVLISASGINIYGDRGDEPLPESAAIGTSGFLRNVAVAWEQEAQHARTAGVRVVCVRIAMVLGKEAGALPLMARVFRLGGGGRLGTGRQWMPWIHIRDVAALFLHAARTELLTGPINGCAPNPVRNADFTRILGKIVRRPTVVPVPAFILRAALRNESSLLLDSLRVIPQKALQSGFEFRFPELSAALADALGAKYGNSE